MGEYAIRKSDGEEIKIGTCEDMFYLRFEDRDKVVHIEGNVDVNDKATAGQLRFRLPFPDEDAMQLGNYEHHNRGERLYRPHAVGGSFDDFEDPETVKDPGNIQLSHRSGLLINVPCYHGHKLPELQGCKTFWNGKSWSLELGSLRAVHDAKTDTLRIYPIVRCRWCDHQWRYDWADVMDFIPQPMLSRLRAYATA